MFSTVRLWQWQARLYKLVMKKSAKGWLRRDKFCKEVDGKVPTKLTRQQQHMPNPPRKPCKPQIRCADVADVLVKGTLPRCPSLACNLIDEIDKITPLLVPRKRALPSSDVRSPQSLLPSSRFNPKSSKCFGKCELYPLRKCTLITCIARAATITF